uniref:MRG/MORF4L-binding protein-like n=1 Tax=Phallusia mammillata TaxID=59560 RepID=A0A6F9DLT4_9ASCI|nr:MRG/MORF4L-binding protein-like [Phallusia mammillata]
MVTTSTVPIHWNSETEVCLFYAMRGQKPVGINKHFHMMCIHRKFCESIGQSVSSEQLWEHLGTMYNLKALDESEATPFKNTRSEFRLPPEILNCKKAQSKSTVDENVEEDEGPPVKVPTKSNRKRSRQSAPSTPNPSSPAVPTVKRRRQ